MKLFELDESYKVIFGPEVFLLKDFRDLRDNRKNTEIVFQELSFIYFYCDLRSDFQFELDLRKRKRDVIKYVGLPEKWEPDDLLQTCIQVYFYLTQTVSSRLLESAYMAVDKFIAQLKGIDLDERDKSGKPIWNQKQIMDSVKNIPELLDSIRKAEAEFLKNESAEGKLRGDKIKTLYEDGFKKMQINDSN